jgi:hypothetical protein
VQPNSSASGARDSRMPPPPPRGSGRASSATDPSAQHRAAQRMTTKSVPSSPSSESRLGLPKRPRRSAPASVLRG